MLVPIASWLYAHSNRLLVVCSIRAGITGATTDPSLALCRYWNTTSLQWRTDGLLTVGVSTINGKTYLECASAHLTSFIGSISRGAVSVRVNSVSPLSDSGQLVVR